MQLRSACLVILFTTIFISNSHAQSVSINTDGTAPHTSAALDVKSTTKGTLITRMTSAERKAIAAPAAGLMVFDTEEKTIYMYDGAQWLGFQAMNDITRPVSNFTFSPLVEDSAYFGYSVSMWDQFAAIGAPKENNDRGTVYMYRKTGNAWNLHSTLIPPVSSTAQFGFNVNVCGNYLIVGAPFQVVPGLPQRFGVVYIYNFNGTAWTLMQSINGPLAYAGFGLKVDINQAGTYACVGEPAANIGAFTNNGTVRIYNYNGSAFALQTSISDPVPQDDENFGGGLAMSPSGDYVIIGAPNKNTGTTQDVGHMVLYRRAGSSWSQFQTYTPNNPQQFMHIGSRIDVTDNAAMFNTGVGSLYVCNIPPSGTWMVQYVGGMQGLTGATLNNTNVGYIFGNGIVDFLSDEGWGEYIRKINLTKPEASAFGAIAAYGNDYIIGIPLEDRNNLHWAGAVYFGKATP